MTTKELNTDDQDNRDTTLSMSVGGNGDYYLELKETNRGEVVKLDTRISTSGGNASTRVKLAVFELYRALNDLEPIQSDLFRPTDEDIERGATDYILDPHEMNSIRSAYISGAKDVRDGKIKIEKV
jgi:hypothetical protein